MSSLQNLISEINQLHSELEKLKPFKKEDEERLWKKFRLEWNYNSNHIEGNTLTYSQTELLLIFDKTTGDHDMREYEEMKAHDVALKMIAEYAKDKSREITESDVRELNKIILVRPYWSNAQTADGQPTRKLIQPGEYKKEPNSVRLQNGEMFHYASPEETPILMKELIDWYNEVSKEAKLHPVEIAAMIHYKFVRIHPFDDSNGRTSRLLMNYVLLRNDYPPVIIKAADKKNYLTALNKADVGDLNSFIEYIAEELVWSLKISNEAAKGEDIEESGDVFKEIELWKRHVKINETNTHLPPHEIIYSLYQNSIRHLLIDFNEKHKIFNDVFRSTTFKILIGLGRQMNSLQGIKALDKWILKFKDSHLRNSFLIKLKINFSGLNSESDSKTKIESVLEVLIEPNSYKVITGGKINGQWPLSASLSKKEIEEITEASVKTAFSVIKK
jgi:Fic family protein